MKYLKISALISFCVFQSCLDLRTCSTNLSGKYICENNSNTINYLKLNEDGTFLHYYKQNDIILKDSGTWQKSEDVYCTIELSNWKNFNDLGNNYHDFGNGILWINREYLDISPDGESSTSFKKEKN